MIHLVVPVVLHPCTRLFTTNSTRTIHQNGLVLLLLIQIQHARQLLPKSIGVRTASPFKPSHFTLIMIPHVDHYRIRLLHHLIPCRCIQILPAILQTKSRILDAIRHNFRAHFDIQLNKRLLFLFDGDVQANSFQKLYRIHSRFKGLKMDRRQR